MQKAEQYIYVAVPNRHVMSLLFLWRQVVKPKTRELQNLFSEIKHDVTGWHESFVSYLSPSRTQCEVLVP